DGLGYGNQGKAFYVTNPSITGGFWEVQSVYEFAEPLTNGELYTLSFWVKGNAEGIIRPELQSPDYSSNGFGQFSVTQDWQRVELSTTATAVDRQRLIFSYGEFAGTVYIDNVSVTAASGGGGSSTILVRDPEVKKAIVESELERWISTVVSGLPYVNAWDVVNEPMDDGWGSRCYYMISCIRYGDDRESGEGRCSRVVYSIYDFDVRYNEYIVVLISSKLKQILFQNHKRFIDHHIVNWGDL